MDFLPNARHHCPPLTTTPERFDFPGGWQHDLGRLTAVWHPVPCLRLLSAPYACCQIGVERQHCTKKTPNHPLTSWSQHAKDAWLQNRRRRCRRDTSSPSFSASFSCCTSLSPAPSIGRLDRLRGSQPDLGGNQRLSAAWHPVSHYLSAQT